MKFSKEKTEQIEKILQKVACYNCEVCYVDYNNKTCECMKYSKPEECNAEIVGEALEEISILLDD